MPGLHRSQRRAATSPTCAPPRRDGDDYVLNGQKIWISSAHIAKWGLFLVRTDPDAIACGEKHVGITALIVDMEADGIEGAAPSFDIAGEEMFNEVFFTDARVPAAYRLGDEGAGWQVAMGTLGHERVGTAGLAISMRADLDAMVNLARSANPDALRDPGIRRRIARTHRHRVHEAAQLPGALEDPEGRAQLARGAAGQAAVEPPGPDPRRARGRPAGPGGMMAKAAPAADGGSWNRLYLYQRYTSIGAGTTEVQKNILADKAIRLPSRRKPPRPQDFLVRNPLNGVSHQDFG